MLHQATISGCKFSEIYSRFECIRKMDGRLKNRANLFFIVVDFVTEVLFQEMLAKTVVFLNVCVTHRKDKDDEKKQPNALTRPFTHQRQNWIFSKSNYECWIDQQRIKNRAQSKEKDTNEEGDTHTQPNKCAHLDAYSIAIERCGTDIKNHKVKTQRERHTEEQDAKRNETNNPHVGTIKTKAEKRSTNRQKNMYYSYFCVFGIHFRKNIAAFSHFNLRIWNVCVLWRSGSSSSGKKIIPERKIKFLLELGAIPVFVRLHFDSAQRTLYNK